MGEVKGEFGLSFEVLEMGGEHFLSVNGEHFRFDTREDACLAGGVGMAVAGLVFEHFEKAGVIERGEARVEAG